MVEILVFLSDPFIVLEETVSIPEEVAQMLFLSHPELEDVVHVL
jgi:hypothetical protein